MKKKRIKLVTMTAGAAIIAALLFGIRSHFNGRYTT